MGGLKQTLFRRARFDPLENGPLNPGDKILSLPDLINFNAEVNPDHTFCVQAERKTNSGSDAHNNGSYKVNRITFKELKVAVDACSYWLRKSLGGPKHASGDNIRAHNKPAPVALFLESDVGLFIYLAALLASGIPAVLLSARLSFESVRHLLKETKARSILLSKRTERQISQEVVDLVDIKIAVPYSFFLDTSNHFQSVNDANQNVRMEVNEEDVDVLLLHSSGTTGLPKPIRVAHRYLLGYAACHEFEEHETSDWLNLSTLPLYHGFGLLAPCLSLSVGMCCCFPPSSIIPAARSTLKLLSTFGARSIMTVPNILEEIVSLPEAELHEAFSLLRPMRFVAVGGGPLSPDVGATLAEHSIRILNHYGATEIGAIAPIFEPNRDYDWKYLRLRTDLGLQLRLVSSERGIEGSERYKLVGYPFGWRRPFEIQDELVKNLDSSHLEVKILGRRDDLIVLKNGEKVFPQMLEAALSQDAAIKTAVCIGEGHFEVIVLVESSSLVPEDYEIFVDHVWKLISTLNSSLDHHARVSSKRAIIVKPPGKTIPRSDKGSIMRKEIHIAFEEDIYAAYEALELESISTQKPLDTDRLENSICDLIKLVTSSNLTIHGCEQTNEDFFELGMDSLQATRLVRLLNSSIEKAAPAALMDGRLTPSFIYQHSTLGKLAEAVGVLIHKQVGIETFPQNREAQMRAIVDDCLPEIDTQLDIDVLAGFGATVLLTGSTGNLGAHTLSCLAQSEGVARIICLNRRLGKVHDNCRVRQEHANSNSGAKLDSNVWNKIEFMNANMQAPNLGLTKTELKQLTDTVTHIIHLAWPMDFNRRLNSFRPQLDAFKTLIRLARSVHRARPHIKPRVLLASSISVVRHYREQIGSSLVPEKPIEDPLVTTAMGYAEAKWVCERMLSYVGQQYPEDCEPMLVRIGQLSGPEREGIWKTEEHIPALIKASQMISAFPFLQGEFSWLPVDRAARALVDILFQAKPAPESIYHLENPIRQPLSDLVAFVANELQLQEKVIPFKPWIEQVAAAGCAPSLVEFFRNEFQELADGTIVLNTSEARRASAHLRGSGGICKDMVVEYVRRWKRTGFLA